MTALTTLLLCALLPWGACRAIGIWLDVDPRRSAAARERALILHRKIVLRTSVIMLPACAVAGALLVDPVFSTRWPTAGSWFFAGLCTTVSWASIALCEKTPEEREAMSSLETLGRVSQMMAVPSLGLGLSLLGSAFIEAYVPMIAPAKALLAALLSVFATIVASPWLVMWLGIWRVLPIEVDTDRRVWQVAHLPAPAPFLTHAAAMPWLRTVLLTDGLFRRAPDPHWRALVKYEIGGAGRTRRERAFRWSFSIPLSLVVFMGAAAVGADDPRKLVAATVLAVSFTLVASWNANRQPSSTLSLDDEEPSMQELAQTLRSLPPRYGQALPRTSHRPLGTALYDRLYALGHDPGRRSHR